MKKQTLSSYSFSFFLAGLLLLMTSCDKDNAGTPTESYQIVTESYVFYANQEKYQEVNIKRTNEGYCQVPSEILKVKRDESKLSITIARPKNCSVSYEIIWDGAVMESFPMMANIFLKAVSENCATTLLEQGNIATDMLVIDLEKTFKDIPSSSLKDTNFMVKEACSLNDFQCMENCNLSVSN